MHALKLLVLQESLTSISIEVINTIARYELLDLRAWRHRENRSCPVPLLSARLRRQVQLTGRIEC
jgi:hypothetical protein